MANCIDNCQVGCGAVIGFCILVLAWIVWPDAGALLTAIFLIYIGRFFFR